MKKWVINFLLAQTFISTFIRYLKNKISQRKGNEYHIISEYKIAQKGHKCTTIILYKKNNTEDIKNIKLMSYKLD